ncbi:unnamed protein product [Thelazia callipaeda]|uniref:C2H2-type domain-containing protein n=1 Tax=Thelazia callipaeda TaxID=103827 RepID=A0A0N5CXN9_THECL|nr:unnamed protein product [Thelazia callipaeda]
MDQFNLWRCPFCFQAFVSLDTRNEHVDIYHASYISGPSRLSVCCECGIFIYSHLSCLHLMKHFELAFKCANAHLRNEKKSSFPTNTLYVVPMQTDHESSNLAVTPEKGQVSQKRKRSAYGSSRNAQSEHDKPKKSGRQDAKHQDLGHPELF